MNAMGILKLKDRIRARDGYRCVDCQMTQDEHIEKTGRKLDVHRKVPDSEYTEDGTETLCRECHGKRGRKRRKVKDRYSQCKVDSEMLALGKEAAARAGVDFQDWLSDVANQVASDFLGRPPIKRRPKPPSEKK